MFTLRVAERDNGRTNSVTLTSRVTRLSVDPVAGAGRDARARALPRARLHGS